MSTMKKKLILAIVALAALGTLSCSSELTDNAAPVELVVTMTQTISQIDLEPTAAGCTGNVGTVNMQVIPKNATAEGTLLSVRVRRYRVSYRRVDGGTMVPAPFVRSIDTLIGIGQTAGLTNFLILEGEAIAQAPFAALLPQNGGRDPETGRSTVKLEVVVEIFGETLGGENVYDSTTFPLDFCFACGGCG
jgi:hypothetical protein